LRQGEPLLRQHLPVFDVPEFRQIILGAVANGERIAALVGIPQDDETLHLVALIAGDFAGELRLLAAPVGDSYPSLAAECPQAAVFEREIAEQWGIVPTGHPWLKPLRYHPSYRPGRDAWQRDPTAPIAPAVGDFFRVTGGQTHEVAVGPVHAGVIEPGHFRFQCHGEEVLHLEIALGYQHRGIERALPGGPHPRTIHHMETLAGDTTIGHATAYCQASKPSPVAPYPRAPKPSAPSPLNSNASPITPATSARLPAILAFCPPPPTAGGCAAIFSI